MKSARSAKSSPCHSWPDLSRVMPRFWQVAPTLQQVGALLALRFMIACLPAVVAGPGAGLLPASPQRPESRFNETVT